MSDPIVALVSIAPVTIAVALVGEVVTVVNFTPAPQLAVTITPEPVLVLPAVLGLPGPPGPPGPAGAAGAAGIYESPTLFSVVSGGTPFVVPAGKSVIMISVVPASGDRVLVVTTASGQEIINAEIDANDGWSQVVGRRYHTGTTLTFTGFTGQAVVHLL